MSTNKSSSSLGRLVAGMALIGLGALFLLAQVVNIWAFIWPFFIIGTGALFFVGMLVNKGRGGGLAIPGSIISMIGLMLLVMSVFHNWESWAYAWTLIIVAVGIGIWIMGVWNEKPRAKRAGKEVMKVGGILFLCFGAFFELGAALMGYRRLGGVLWPVVLMGFGAWLIFRRPRSAQITEAAAPVKSNVEATPAQAAEVVKAQVVETPAVVEEPQVEAIEDQLDVEVDHFAGDVSDEDFEAPFPLDQE